MAGKPGTVATLKAELAAAQQRIASLENGGQPPAPPPPPVERSIEPEELHDGTRKRLIRDMLAQADDGASMDEIAAAWNVEAETLQQWAERDVEFAASLRRARTRARASIMRTMRKALNDGRNLPGSLVDKLMRLYPAGEAAADEDASALIMVDAR